MKVLEFFGSSDDNFGYRIDGKDVDEVGCYEKAGVFRVLSREAWGVMRVVGYYAHQGTEGVWTVGIAPDDEDVPLPNWPISVGNQGYSTVLSIEAPDDVTVEATRG